MSLDFSIEDFKRFYCDRLLSKEEMIRQLNITDYTYKKIIKEFNLKRPKTNKINRFKAVNGLIENLEIVKVNETEETKSNKEYIKTDKNDEGILERVKKSLETSKKNRLLKKY